MIACASCGAAVADTDTVCPRCGASLADEPVEQVRAQARPFLVAGAVVVVAAIVAASLAYRGLGPVRPFADPSTQRRDVDSFHSLVVAGRWEQVYPLVAEPPAGGPAAFADLMRSRELDTGRITRIDTVRMRLMRSRSVPVLQVRERITLSGGRTTEVVSNYVWQDRWLFGFSAAQ